MDVQVALSGTQQRVQFDALQMLASASCPLNEYSISELEEEFGEQIVDLFVGSELETTIKVRTYLSVIVEKDCSHTYVTGSRSFGVDIQAAAESSACVG